MRHAAAIVRGAAIETVPDDYERYVLFNPIACLLEQARHWGLVGVGAFAGSRPRSASVCGAASAVGSLRPRAQSAQPANVKRRSGAIRRRDEDFFCGICLCSRFDSGAEAATSARTSLRESANRSADVFGLSGRGGAAIFPRKGQLPANPQPGGFSAARACPILRGSWSQTAERSRQTALSEVFIVVTTLTVRCTNRFGLHAGFSPARGSRHTFGGLVGVPE